MLARPILLFYSSEERCHPYWVQIVSKDLRSDESACIWHCQVVEFGLGQRCIKLYIMEVDPFLDYDNAADNG